MAGGQILTFPIDIDRRPYNTLTLPCECVIFAVFLLNLFCGCLLLHKLIYGVAVLQKQTEAILEYYLRFKFGNRRH